MDQRNPPGRDPLIARFAIGIRLYQVADGQTQVYLHSENDSVSEEIIIMHLKAFLRAREAAFYRKFDAGRPQAI